MASATTQQPTHCAHCGAVLPQNAVCAACLRPPQPGSAEYAARLERYATLPARVANGGIIMPQ